MNKNGSKWITRNARLAIYLRDGMACAYCGNTIEDGAKLTLDHLTPRSAGGNNKPANLITACHLCNSNRGDREVGEFISSVAAYLNHGVTAEMIGGHIANCTGRDLKPFRVMAAEIIKLRPVWADAIKLASR
jgi:hypothetical protein